MFHFISKVIIGTAAFIGGVFGFHKNIPSSSPLAISSILPSITITSPVSQSPDITISPIPSKVKSAVKSTPKSIPVIIPTPERIYIFVTPTPQQTGFVFDPITGQVISGNTSKPTPTPTPKSTLAPTTIPTVDYFNEAIRIVNLTIERERKLLDITRNDVASMKMIVSALSSTDNEALILFKKLTELRIDRVEKQPSLLENLISSHIDIRGIIYESRPIADYQYIRVLEGGLSKTDTLFNAFYNDSLDYNNKLSNIVSYITPNYQQSFLDSLNGISSQLKDLNNFFRSRF